MKKIREKRHHEVTGPEDTRSSPGAAHGCCNHQPAAGGMPKSLNGASQAFYTCPMHPEVRQIGPGDCTICGMALEPENLAEAQEDDRELQTMYYRFWVAALFSVPLLLLNMSMGLGPNVSHMGWLQCVLATPVVVWCGWPFFHRAWTSVKHRSLNMFTLVALGVGVSYGYSLFALLYPTAIFTPHHAVALYFEPAAVIIALVLLGQVLELKARAQAGGALRQLLELHPTTARIIRPTGEEEVPIALIKVGDICRVRPGEKIPFDGIILEGSSSVNQAMMTGESFPVVKHAGDAVTGGTINGTGSFTIRAVKVGKETMLYQIVEMVAKAQRTRAPIQRLADVISGYFVPTVIIIAMMTAICWYVWGPEPKIGYALVTSVAVLIIACPCALGLATPMSIMVGTSRGAREGIVIKNAEALERLEKIDTLVLDKTGTLTEGKPCLSNVIPVAPGFDRSRLLLLAASLENSSEHPIAEAITQAAKTEGMTLLACSNFISISGKGITGIIENHSVALGNAALMKSLQLDVETFAMQATNYYEQAHTVMFMAVDGIIVGFMTISDAVKPTAKPTIDALQREGIKVVMLTGDHRATAQAIAKILNIGTVEAEVLPEHKFDFIQSLQQQGHKVAMAGDGINDAPALAQADVGIAMGTGTDVAIESAGITLLSGDLRGILRARRLSHISMRNIRQNLCLAFMYNVLAIPVAAGVFYPAFGWLLNPMIASAAMALSSVSVILNASRISKKSLEQGGSQ